jgi:hypothetical protein
MVLARLLSAQPTTDGEEWRLKFALHDDAWYLDAYGQNPAAFVRQPGIAEQRRLPFPWRPYWYPLSGLVDTDDTAMPRSSQVSLFGLSLDLTTYPAQMTITGNTPCNTPSTGKAPQAPAQATTANTGGSLEPGTYYVRVSANSQKGPETQTVVAVVPAGTSTNTITVSGLVWSEAATLIVVLIGKSPLEMREVGFADASPDGYGNPTEVTVSTYPVDALGPHDVAAQRFVVSQTVIAHGGVWGAALTSVSGADATITGAGWTTDEWAGRALSLYYRDGSEVVRLNRTVVSNTSDTLTLNASGFAAGDVVVMRTTGDHITSNTIGDDKFVNSFASAGLDVTGTEKGRVIRIIAGTGANQPPKTIASNTSTVFTINGTWDVTPDSTSIWIVTEPAPMVAPKITAVYVDNGTRVISTKVATVQTATTAATSLLIEVATANITGEYLPMRFQPARELYVPAQVATALIADGEDNVADTTNTRTLAAAITSTTATTCTLDATTGLPAVPFLATLGTECVRVTAMSGASVTAMDRGWGGTTAATHLSGSNAVVVTAQPDLTGGRMQVEKLTAHTTLLVPVNSPGPVSWTLDVQQDATGGWLLLLGDGYVGYQPSASDGGGLDTTPSTRTFLSFATRSSGDINLTAASGSQSV